MTTAIAAARFLARHIPAIAQDEAAAELFADIKAAVESIRRVINRPVDPKYCGPCPAKTEGKAGKVQDCATALYAPWDYHDEQYVIEVECWHCHVIHNVDTLIQDALNSVAGLLYSAEEVQEVMRQIGQEIPSRTWRYWRANDKIIVRGWREGEPMYWIDDVKDLVASRPQKLATGATAHKIAG
jgi:hypothetical protein